jgi:hypothetical protein
MRMHLPDIAWIALGGLVAFGLAMVLFGWARRAGHHGEDLGAVSGQWINEHRAQTQEPYR